jgi:hypothetical protein
MLALRASTGADLLSMPLTGVQLAILLGPSQRNWCIANFYSIYMEARQSVPSLLDLWLYARRYGKFEVSPRRGVLWGILWK